MEVGTLKFTWKIKNFSKIQTKRLYSDVFSLGRYKWKILAFPKGNNVDYLSIYLTVADSITLPSEWSRNAKFSLTLTNQNDSRSSVTKGTKHKFCKIEPDWGFTSFISHKELHDLSKGFLVDDTCIIEADVTMYEDASVQSSQASKQTNKDDLTKHTTEKDMNGFFGDLQSLVSAKNVVSSEEEVKEALVIIEEALNMAPAELNNPGRMLQLTNAFDVLSSLDDGSILSKEEKAKLLATKKSFISLPERAVRAVETIKLFNQKELVRTTLDRKLGRCLSQFEKAKAETVENEQNIAILQEQVDTVLAQIDETKRKKENSMSKQKEMFKLSKEVKDELDVLVKNLPEYEEKMKAAKEDEKMVAMEWDNMRLLVSSLKKPFHLPIF